MDCIFCKIIAGEIPSFKVYEDENVLAFLDIAPVNPGHTLVVPKKHYENMEEILEAELCKLTVVIKKIGKAVKDSLGAEGYNITENNGPVAGQIVPHLHFHVIPRRQDDGLKLWPQEKYGEGEAEEIVKKIKNGI
ncbi:MAG: HIT family protein [Patescibacteria group bacterium]|nr:HIT family protein [Patescibacteria group bacterium]MDD5294964.1 HIT family protein [Patescibacteria group bacterium]MDD5554589.1 HIT family protein [Patescibacteria group bacterium]